MYDGILRGLFAANKIVLPSDEIKYLTELKTPMTRLFNSFQNQKIIVNYSDHAIQECYLLRYFPLYTQPIIRVLDDLLSKGEIPDFTEGLLQALFIGPGPCPEVYGLIAVIKKINENLNFKIHLRDKYSDSWKYSRDIIRLNLLTGLMKGSKATLYSKKADFADKLFVSNFEEEILCSDFIVFQHCLNEVAWDAYGVLENNILGIIERMKAGALFIVIERSGYTNIFNLIKKIESILIKKESIKIIRSIHAGSIDHYAHDIVNTMPAIITANLLDGIPYKLANGRIPSTKVSFNYLVYKRR